MSQLIRWSWPLCALAWVLTFGIGTPSAAAEAGRLAVEERSAAVSSERTFRLARGTTHLALHWTGAPGADVHVALSRDGRDFGRPLHVELDEAGRRAPARGTYGKMMPARGVRALRVTSDRPLRRLTVLGITDEQPRRPLAGAAGHTDRPAVVSRRDWGADETLRVRADGRELWPPAFSPVQKLIVHHTAGANGDPDPAATIRAIYYYHAVTQGWGDIGYNFLIDTDGRLYEGRHSGDGSTDAGLSADVTPGEDDAGRGVTGAHAYGYNTGTVGIALLGSLNEQDAQPAARETLERLLAWEAERHGLDPRGEGLYTNPVTGASRSLPNVAAHRDVVATDCPGAVFYEGLPEFRHAVARRLSATPPDPPATSPPPAPPAPLPPLAPRDDGSPQAGVAPRPVPLSPSTPYATLPDDPDAGSPTEPTSGRPASRTGRPEIRIRSRSLHGDRRGRVRIRVACRSSAAACSGSITLIASPRVDGIKAPLARRRVRLRPAATRTVTLRIAKRTARALRGHDSVRVIVRITTYGDGSAARSTRRVLRLRVA